MNNLRERLIESLDKAIWEHESLVRYDGGKIIDSIIKDIPELKDKFSRLDMAVQQLLGFYHGKWHGTDILGLIQSMGLTKDEWKILKAEYEISFLDEDNFKEIENFLINNIEYE